MDLIIFEAGVRDNSGEYTKFIESANEKKVDDHIEIMKENRLEGLIVVKIVKHYRLLSTTPRIID